LLRLGAIYYENEEGQLGKQTVETAVKTTAWERPKVQVHKQKTSPFEQSQNLGTEREDWKSARSRRKAAAGRVKTDF
jgi:hypothetical protein